MKRTALLLICISAVVACVGCIHKPMLMVSGNPDGSPLVAEAAMALDDEIMGNHFSASLNIFNMNSTGHPTDIWREEMGHMAVVRTTALEPAVVFVLGDDAARYYAQRLVNRPVNFIFLGVKGDPADYKFMNALNVTGVREELAVKETIDLMVKLVPSARRVAVLADKSLEGDAVVAQIRATTDLPIPVVDIRQAATLPEWMAALNDLQTKADILCIGSYRSVLPDENSKEVISPSELLRMTSEANHLPDCSFWPDAVDRLGSNGVMASVFVPITAQARIAGRMAIRFMYYDVPLRKMPIVGCDARETKVSHGRAERVGVTLPLGTETTPTAPVETGKSTF